MNENFEAVCDFLEEHEIHFERDEARGICHAWLTEEGILLRLLVITPPDEPSITLLLRLPIQAPAGRRAAVGELLQRLNWQTKVGHFDFDHSDGEVRFKIAFWLHDSKLSPAMLHHCLGASVLTVTTAFPAFTDVVFGDKSPDAALARLEKEDLDEDPADGADRSPPAPLP